MMNSSVKQLSVHADVWTPSTSLSMPRAGRSSTAGARYIAAPARWLATAGLLVIVAGLVFVSFRGSGSSPGQFSMAMATPDIMKSLPYTAIDTAECTTVARPDGTVRSLIGQTPTKPPFLPKLGQPVPAEFPTVIASPFAEFGGVLDPLPMIAGLPEADDATVASINETVANLSACRVYAQTPDPMQPGNMSAAIDGRFYAVYSDDFFRKEAFVVESDDGKELIIASGWFSNGPAPWTVEEAGMIEDGRVLALVSPTQPTGFPFRSWLMVFSNAGDRWLIDEIAQVNPQQPNLSGPDALQTLEIVLRDDAEATVGSPVTFHSRPITVTIANIGARPHEFQILSLGLMLTIEPGHSVSFELTPPPGLYVMESYVPSGLHPEQTMLRLERVLRIVDEGTPVPLG